MTSGSHRRAGSVSSLPSTLFRRSLPGSASELRYPQGGGSLPAGYGSSSSGVVVRRAHRGRWGPPRDDSNKVLSWSWDNDDYCRMLMLDLLSEWDIISRSSSSIACDLTIIFSVSSMGSGTAGRCWALGLKAVGTEAALMMRMTERLYLDRSFSLPADRQMYRLWPSCCRSNWRPLTRRSSKLGVFCSWTLLRQTTEFLLSQIVMWCSGQSRIPMLIQYYSPHCSLRRFKSLIGWLLTVFHSPSPCCPISWFSVTLSNKGKKCPQTFFYQETKQSI